MEEARQHPALDAGGPLRLHIGGRQVKDGWTIVDIQPGPGVDVVGSCTDLSRFAAETVTEIYASHVLEHLSYQGEVETALREFHRVLRPDGLLRISVPDLEILCRLFVHPGTSLRQKLTIMQIMFGGQADPYDFHKSGLIWDLMGVWLTQAGFVDIYRVEEHGLFTDSSLYKIRGALISLNIRARRP